MLRTSAALVVFLALSSRPCLAQGTKQVTCESRSDRFTECPIPENSRVKLVRTVSDSPCTLGRTYGVERARIWVRTGCRAVFEVTPPAPSGPGTGQPTTNSRSYLLRCESTRNSTSECPVDPSATVKVATERGTAPCTEGQTWGRLGGSLFVSRGCRADFEVTPVTRPGTFQRPGNTNYWITCESRDKRRFQCRIGERDVPRLIRRLSREPCTKETGWGVAEGYLWVDKGCRAEFEISRVK